MLWACLNGGFIRATVLCGYRRSLFDDHACFSEFFIAFCSRGLLNRHPLKFL